MLSALSRIRFNVAAWMSAGQAFSGTAIPSLPASQRIWPSRSAIRLS